jgi:hypothetical protein
MMKANEGRDCDGSLESPLPGEDERTAGEGPSARDAVTGIVRRRKGEPTDTFSYRVGVMSLCHVVVW